MQNLDFIHGKLSRFKDFTKRVGIGSNEICENCYIERDSFYLNCMKSDRPTKKGYVY